MISDKTSDPESPKVPSIPAGLEDHGRLQALHRIFDGFFENEFSKVPSKGAMSGPGTRKNHFLPITLLTGFVGPRNMLLEISLDKTGQVCSSREASPKSVAYQPDLYTTVKDGKEDRHYLEAVFGAFETHWGEIRKEWENGGWGLQPANKGLWEFRVAWFLAFQFLRTPYAVALSKTIYDAGSHGNQVKFMLTGSRDLARWFFTMRWALYRAKESFFTADIPFTFSSKSGTKHDAGPECIKECIFPLTKDLILIMNLKKDLCSMAAQPHQVREFNRAFASGSGGIPPKKLYLPDDKTLGDLT